MKALIDIQKRPDRPLKGVLKALQNAASLSITDDKGVITYVNDRFVDLTGYTREELLGANHKIIESGFHANEFYHDLWKTISSGKIWKGEIKNRAKNGSFFWSDLTIAPILDQNGKPEKYVGLRYNITKRKELEEREDEFISVASHEIKTPVTILKLMVSVLIDESLGKLNAKQHMMAKKISQACDRLAATASDLLDLRRLEMHHISPDCHEVSCSDYFNEITSIYPALGAEQNVKINVKVEPSLPKVCLSENLVIRVVSNLISNAIRFSNTKIEIQVQKISENIHISISDDGEGISAENLAKLYQKFAKIGTPIKRGEYKGTGLGLAICKEIIEDFHRGKIWVESTVGTGTTFYFTLPIKCQARSLIKRAA